MQGAEEDSDRTKLLNNAILEYLKVAVIPPVKLAFISEHDVLSKSFADRISKEQELRHSMLR